MISFQNSTEPISGINQHSTEKEIYQKEAFAHFKELASRISLLKTKVAHMESEEEINQIYKELEHLQETQKIASLILSELKESDQENWIMIKFCMDNLWNSLPKNKNSNI